MDVQIAGRKFSLRQSWGDMKAFKSADAEFDLRERAARNDMDLEALKSVDAERFAWVEAHLKAHLSPADGAEWDGDLDAVDDVELSKIAQRCSAPLMELADPFADKGAKPA